MAVHVTIDSVQPVDRGNHTVWPLLNAKHGLTAGATAMAANYTDTDFVITGTHDDQEIFYVLAGTGAARGRSGLSPCRAVPLFAARAAARARTDRGAS